MLYMKVILNKIFSVFLLALFMLTFSSCEKNELLSPDGPSVFNKNFEDCDNCDSEGNSNSDDITDDEDDDEDDITDDEDDDEDDNTKGFRPVLTSSK